RNIWTMGPNVLRVIGRYAPFSYRPLLSAYIITCPERQEILQQTLADLRSTDWREVPQIEVDQSPAERKQERIVQTARQMLTRAVASGAAYILYLEDDLIFNRHLRHNLEHWWPRTV